MDNSQIQYYQGLTRQLQTNLTNALKRIARLEEISESEFNVKQQGITPSQSESIPTDWVQIHDHVDENSGGELELGLGIHNHSSNDEGGPAYAVYYPG